MKATPVDAFRAKVEGERVVVEFGQSAHAVSGGDGPPVALSDRIAMPLSTARRLVLALDESLKRHPKKPVPPTPDQGAELLSRGQMPVNARPDEGGERAALMMRLINDLGIPYQYERSFRLTQGALLANRFLLTIDKRDIPGHAKQRALQICRQLGMPERLQAAAEERFEEARCLHFGFEGSLDSLICKLYLERAIAPADAERARARGEPLLQHLAFKWDLLKDAQVVTRYLWYPARSVEGIAERLSRVYRGGAAEFSLDIARAVLQLAAARTTPERLQYLEVEEDENQRRSFDLNLYATGMLVKDLQRVLHQLREHYGVRPGEFQALYDQVKTKLLGHLAGGIHRNGRDFFNVYYGVAGFPKFSGPAG